MCVCVYVCGWISIMFFPDYIRFYLKINASYKCVHRITMQTK